MSVSRWERGVQEPSAQVFIQLGNLSSGFEKWYFWELAGLQRSEVSGVSGSANNLVIPATEHLRRAAKKRPLVAIPMTQVKVGGDARPISLDSPAEEVIAAPEAWCPHPNQTVCATIVDDSMSPTIPKNAVVCIDRAEQSADRLNGKIVVVCHPNQGYRVARLQRRNSHEILAPENKNYLMFTFEDGWQLEGKVLWWITRPN